MTLAFAHPCLLVPDLEKARKFYQDMFGFEVVDSETPQENVRIVGPTGADVATSRTYMMKAHDCFLELIESGEPLVESSLTHFRDMQVPGPHRLTFHVDDCWTEYRRFQELGGFAMGIPAGDARHGYSVYCRDPFGNVTELTEKPRPGTVQSRLPGLSTMPQ